MSIYQKLLEVQKEIKGIKKDATNSFFKNKYFDINSLLAEVKPILNKHGILLLQPLTCIGDKPALTTTLIDTQDVESGNIQSITPLPEIVDAQKQGSAITYFRRYALQSLLALEAEDDDGNVATNKKASGLTTTEFAKIRNTYDKDLTPPQPEMWEKMNGEQRTIMQQLKLSKHANQTNK